MTFFSVPSPCLKRERNFVCKLFPRGERYFNTKRINTTCLKRNDIITTMIMTCKPRRLLSFRSLKTAYATAVLGGSAYSSVWIGSPHEQIVRVDGVRRVPDTDFDLLHLARPADASRGVGPLGVPLFQPPLRSGDACYAIGYAAGGHGYNETVTAVLRPDARRCDREDALCFTVSRKPRTCTGDGSVMPDGCFQPGLEPVFGKPVKTGVLSIFYNPNRTRNQNPKHFSVLINILKPNTKNKLLKNIYLWTICKLFLFAGNFSSFINKYNL